MSAATMNGSDRQAAVEAWLDAASRGDHLTGAALAEQFGRSDGWGRARIREARQSTARSWATDPHTSAARAGVADRHGTVTSELDAGTDPQAAEPGRTAAVTAVTGGIGNVGDPVPAGPAAAVTASGTGSQAAEPVRSVPPVVSAGASGASDVPGWIGWVTSVAVLAVAAAAGVASVEHLATLARLAGVEGWRAWLLPASLDGLVVASSMCVYRAHLLAERAGPLAWSALLGGMVVSVVGNVLSVYPEAVQEAWLKVTVGGSAPLALALSFDLALRQTRRIAQAPTAKAVEGVRDDELLG